MGTCENYFHDINSVKWLSGLTFETWIPMRMSVSSDSAPLSGEPSGEPGRLSFSDPPPVHVERGTDGFEADLADLLPTASTLPEEIPGLLFTATTDGADTCPARSPL